MVLQEVIERGRRRRRDRSAVPFVTKYILFFWNFACELVGIGMGAIGAYILATKNKLVTDAIDFFLDPSCVLCLVGSVMTFIAFFGCMGSLRENTVFLKIFHYFLSLLLLGQVALAIITFIFYYAPDVRDKMGLFPEQDFKDAIVKYRDDPDMQNLIDNFQKLLGCCGVSNDETGYKDWNANPYFNCSANNPSAEKCSVPPSCCIPKPDQIMNLLCGAEVQKIENGILVAGDTTKVYTDGCLYALGSWINQHSLIIGGVMLGVLLPQIFLICMARSVADGVKTQKRKWERR
ncbi:tetraspanin-33-like [Haliotis rufescens]|uniref:tetraspanin-33-like n=1 Tax=Haliotis rufescens TaxID=6454 RepID=UPI001EAFC091|nr:tetraspanin-33-like [Haliotis rufescens]